MVGAPAAGRASSERILELSDDSRSGNGVCRAAGAGLWQLPERVPEPLAGGRKRRNAAFALPELRPHAGVVGECAAVELGGAAGKVPRVRGVDWVAVCGGGSGRGRLV